MRDVGSSGTSCHALHPSLGFVLGSLDQGTCKLSALALASSTTFSWKPSCICLHYPPYIPDTFSQRTSTLHLTSALIFHQIWGALLRVFGSGLLSFLIRWWSSYRHRMATVGKIPYYNSRQWNTFDVRLNALNNQPYLCEVPFWLYSTATICFTMTNTCRAIDLLYVKISFNTLKNQGNRIHVRRWSIESVCTATR